MKLYPTGLKLKNPSELIIEWNDGCSITMTVQQLREQCPCASCRERRKAKAQETELLPVLRPEETRPLQITNMRPVGNYAYGITFSDGHDTGIYTLEFLRELGKPNEANPD